jgi:hypothetical protein
MAFDAFLQQYGWVGFLTYIAVKEVLPVFRDKFLPHKLAEQKAERQRLERLEERAFQNEERQTKAVENMNIMMQQFAQAITVNNERMAQLIVGHTEHDRKLNDALISMRERVAVNASVMKER